MGKGSHSVPASHVLCVSGQVLNLSRLFLHLQNGTSSNTCLTGMLENFHNTDTASNGAWQVIMVQAVAHFRIFIRETLVGLLLSGRLFDK